MCLNHEDVWGVKCWEEDLGAGKCGLLEED